MNKEEALKRIGNAYYGEGAAIGDGKFLEMLMKFLMTFLTGCPLGARRAKAMMEGGAFRRKRAMARLEYAAYEWTGSDYEMTQKVVDAAVKVGDTATEEEFEEFAAMSS